MDQRDLGKLKGLSKKQFVDTFFVIEPTAKFDKNYHQAKIQYTVKINPDISPIVTTDLEITKLSNPELVDVLEGFYRLYHGLFFKEGLTYKRVKQLINLATLLVDTYEISSNQVENEDEDEDYDNHRYDPSVTAMKLLLPPIGDDNADKQQTNQSVEADSDDDAGLDALMDGIYGYSSDDSSNHADDYNAGNDAVKFMDSHDFKSNAAPLLPLSIDVTSLRHNDLKDDSIDKSKTNAKSKQKKQAKTKAKSQNQTSKKTTKLVDLGNTFTGLKDFLVQQGLNVDLSDLEQLLNSDNKHNNKDDDFDFSRSDLIKKLKQFNQVHHLKAGDEVNLVSNLLNDLAPDNGKSNLKNPFNDSDLEFPSEHPEKPNPKNSDNPFSF